MPPSSSTGSCFCNAVRFTAAGPPSTVSVCHCAMCRRCVGSPGVSWATFRRDALTIEGSPVWFRSSDHARRGFCGACGTSLFFETSREPHEIDVTVPALHDAAKFAPRYHVWMASKLAWETVGDSLPRFREDGGSLNRQG